ncbi:hypothetical protein [Dactylosporangium sp. NPDC049140]|jgi:hypothetical protein|uniref:hypothetical protein n=1 Tax=Dactylosporangium sp. NPDC049140 TaxID=3155647 RepID=UPI0033EE71DD
MTGNRRNIVLAIAVGGLVLAGIGVAFGHHRGSPARPTQVAASGVDCAALPVRQRPWPADRPGSLIPAHPTTATLCETSRPGTVARPANPQVMTTGAEFFADLLNVFIGAETSAAASPGAAAAPNEL